MFGRVRAASSTLDCLELEKPPSKLIKDDAFSIYEATLIKLKLGSQRDLGSPPDKALESENGCSCTSPENFCTDATSSDCSEANSTTLKVLNNSQIVSQGRHNEMAIDTDYSSLSDCQSIGGLQQRQSRNLSILYLFSKFRNSGQAKSLSQPANMMIENDGSTSSASTSTISSYCKLLSTT